MSISTDRTQFIVIHAPPGYVGTRRAPRSPRGDALRDAGTLALTLVALFVGVPAVLLLGLVTLH